MKFKNIFSINNLISVAKNYFSLAITENRRGKIKYPLSDVLMSAIGLFHQKYLTLKQFDFDTRHKKTVVSNMENLYKIPAVPSDTQLRAILDKVDPKEIRGLFKSFFRMLQRGNFLKEFIFYKKYYVIALDGTGYFESKKIHCDYCCEKNHSDGTKSYYHQSLAGILLHPQGKVVLPIMPEAILLQDGNEKNDCERNATKRLLENLKKDYPRMNIIINEDGIASNAPHIETLEKLGFKYVLGAKPGDHVFMFENFAKSVENGSVNNFELSEGTITHYFNWLIQTPLNKSHPNCLVNFLDYHQFDSSSIKKPCAKKRKAVSSLKWLSVQKLATGTEEIIWLIWGNSDKLVQDEDV